MAPIHREVGMANPARSMTAEPRCVVDMTVIMYRSTAALHSHTVGIELSVSGVAPRCVVRSSPVARESAGTAHR